MDVLYYLFCVASNKKKIAGASKPTILCFLTESVSKEKRKHEKQSYYPSAGFNLFNVAAEKIDYGVGKQTERYAVGNVVGKGHNGKSHKCGNCLVGRKPVDFLYASHHKNAYVDKSRRGCTAGNKLGNGA